MQAAAGMSGAAYETIGISGRSVRSTSGDVAAAALYGGVPVLLGLWRAHRFSAEREAAILQGYAAGWSIPADIRRRLRRKHFHRTKRDLAARHF